MGGNILSVNSKSKKILACWSFYIIIRKTELALLCHIKECGMRVQSPIPNKAGELLTVLADGTCASMLEWISGHTVEKDDVTYYLCFQIGAMVAQMHQSVQNFHPDEILGYDAALCGRICRKLEQEVESGVLCYGGQAEEKSKISCGSCRFVKEQHSDH